MARRDDDDDDALFVKDGVPVKFCFHKSVTQGRGQIARDVERNGGQVVSDERAANVLLVDEQEDLALIRRRYYSSTELYRLSLFVEPRGFVKACIRSGTYLHIAPVRQGMPGRAVVARKARVPFTEEDRDHLAYYLATRCPTHDGRMGNSAYKDLERLSQTDDPSWAWAKRHTFHSWREHYKKNPGMMDARIEHYLERLKDVGHHFGYDPRSHGHRDSGRELEEEEGSDDEDDEGNGDAEQWRRIEREERGRPAVRLPGRPNQTARDYLARHSRDLLPLEEEEDDEDIQEEEEFAVQEPQCVKRHRPQPDRRHGSQEMRQVKKARAFETLSNDRVVPSADGGRDKSTSVREEDSAAGESEEIEGSDLFGDRAHGDELSFDFEDQGVEFPMPFSPGGSPIPDQDGPPLSTQATLIASPDNTKKEPSPARSVDAPAQMPLPSPTPTMPPSPQQTLDTSEERVVARVPARGVSAQPGSSMSKEKWAGGEVALTDAPYRNTRARSRSVEPQSQPSQQRAERGGISKGKMKEILIEEDVHIKEGASGEGGESGPVSVTGGLSLQDEMSVEGQLLETSAGDMGEHDDDVDGSGEEDMPELPPFQEIEVGGEPSDSDDAETHGSLVRGAVREGSTGEGDMGSELGSEQEEEERASELGVSPVPKPPQPRATRSQGATWTEIQRQPEFSPRRTRSGARARAFPSPGTKARAVVDRAQEVERRMPYVPPQGTKAARGRGKGKA